uniref:transmembrane protein 230-like n=1 Tax=Callithrix jacchus TaxID=9483 RepID=UPI00159D7810|nr:transmembrane protein 230-like [Callithrix jacchus]
MGRQWCAQKPLDLERKSLGTSLCKTPACGTGCEWLLFHSSQPFFTRDAVRTNLATGSPSSKVKYSRLSSRDDGYIDLQFKKSPPKIPYKAIALATVLFLISTFLIIIGSLLLSGYVSKVGAGQAVPVLIIGILVFLPGFYHLCIAFCAAKAYHGYSYDDIPDFADWHPPHI